MKGIFTYQSLVFVFILISISCSTNKMKIEPCWEPKSVLMAHLRFLASDELRGRRTGTCDAKIAARYIAEQYRSYGMLAFNESLDFFQSVTLNDEPNLKMLHCNNVIGYIEGTDSILKDEYILLVAHYDHLGVIQDTSNLLSDSIYNGARDNGMGTTALLFSANVLANNPPFRSVIFLAATGEEEGMLGSEYFIEHCPVAVEDIVFVLNNDGGGYNDTTLIRVGGKNRIELIDEIWTDLESSGIKSLPYPEDLEYLYDLGDNITFAKKGIPAITISPGFDKIDDEILKYIHKPIDEADDAFNYSYLLKFSQAYTKIAMFVSNSETVPFWKEENEYYARGIKLYREK